MRERRPQPPEAPNRRPRLLVVAHSASLYGADRCLIAAVPTLLRTFDVTLSLPQDGPAAELYEEMGADVVRLPDYALRPIYFRPIGALRWLTHVFVATTRLTFMHRRARFDIVYANSLAASIGSILRVLWRVPHVVHVHEVSAQSQTMIKVLLAIDRRTADLLICNSHFSRDSVVAYQPALAARSVVVHNGLEAPAAPPSPPPHDRLRIVCVGRIHPKKGQGVLLEALRQARADGREWEVHLCGDTLPQHKPLEDELLAFVHGHGLEDAVYWHGFVESMDGRYGGYDLAVVPSVRPEEFSLVCLEAQQMNLPVVATGPGGPSEVLEDGKTGLIVPPGDADSLYRAICRLEDDPALRVAMGRSGRDRMLELFSVEAFADGLRDALVGRLATKARSRR